MTILAVTTCVAGEALSSKKVVIAPEECRFHAKEWQIDTATVGTAGTYGGTSFEGLGGNLGVNYFFSKYFGIGVDNSVGSERRTGLTGFDGLQAYDTLQADLLARYPICSWNLAPYAMLGGGAHWGNASQGEGNVGGGIEYRALKNAALFADCRWLYGDNGSKALSAAMPRIGIRFIF